MGSLFPCPNCRKTFDLPDSARGKTLRCPTCKHQFTAPLIDAAPANGSGEGYRAPVVRPPVTVRPPVVSPAVPPLASVRPTGRPDMRLQDRPRSVVPPQVVEPVDNRRLSRRRSKPRGSNLPVIGVLLVGGGVALLLLVGIGFAIVMLSKSDKTSNDSNLHPVVAANDGGNGGEFVPAGPAVGGPAVGGPAVGGPVPGGPAVADVPEGSSLRYLWEGSPNIYHVRVEADLGDVSEIHEGNATINASQRSAIPPRAGDVKGSGTGFVINPNGYLLTCAHVVAGAKKIEVTIGGQTYPGTVVTSNRSMDMAIVHIQAQGLPTLSLGDSDRLDIGQDVWALGFPFSDHLGESLKVNRGTLSGITSKAGRKVLQVDASVNPGNSGGPLVSETGLVLGVVTAKMLGEDVSNVGFAGPSSDAKRLLQSKGITFSTEGWDSKLDGKTLYKRVSVATAYIQVTVGPGGGGDNDVMVLKASGWLPKREVNKNGGFPGFPRPDFGGASSGEMIIDSSGRTLIAKGGISLPYLLGDIPQFLVDPLPENDRATWETTSPVTIYEKSGSPRGFGPPGGFPRGPFAPRGGFGGGNTEERTGSEHVVYTRAGVAGNVITIQKRYELSVPASARSGAISLTGNGEIKFDTKQGIPREIKFDARLNDTINGRQVNVPISVSCVLIEGEEREKILHPPSPPPNQQANNGGNQGANPPANAGGNPPNRSPRNPAQAGGPANRQRNFNAMLPSIFPTMGNLPKIVGAAPPAKVPDRSVLLGATARKAVAGGGDRYLIIQLADKNELTVFDLKEEKTVKSIPIPDSDVLIAAGLNDLVVYVRSAKQLQRWSLKSFTQTGTAASPTENEIKGMALGSASAGPLVLHAPNNLTNRDTLGLVLVDPSTFARLPDVIDKINDMPFGIDENPDWTNISCSAEGNLIVAHQRARQGQAILHREGDHWVSVNIKGYYPLATPDGQAVIDNGQSFTSTGASTGPTRFQHGRGAWCLPALAGQWVLSLNEAWESTQSRAAYLKLMLHVGTDAVPIATFPFRVDALTELVDWMSGRYLPFDQHVFLAPNVGCLAVIPASGERIDIYRITMEQLTKKAASDFIFVTSKPPTSAKRGVEMRYTITAKSKSGELTYRLISGPPGAKLSSAGVVTWTPPDGTDEEIVAFSIGIRDGKAKEVMHTFQVRVGKN